MSDGRLDFGLKDRKDPGFGIAVDPALRERWFTSPQIF